MTRIYNPAAPTVAGGRWLLLFLSIALIGIAAAQEQSPESLEEAARRTGLSEEELLERYRTRKLLEGELPDSLRPSEPGLIDISEIDDSAVGLTRPRVILPFELEEEMLELEAVADTDSVHLAEPPPPFFGSDFFRLEPGLFSPPTFGPVPADYLVGLGDEIVVDVWGEVEFRLERVVDRTGAIILPTAGRIVCHNRTLSDIERVVRERLSRSYSGISTTPGEGTTFLDVSLGRLRAIRVFVVGDAVQPGAYELSSVASVFTALYAAGGPTIHGSLRDVRLVRDGEEVASVDIYDYLLAGERTGDLILREGDTVLIPPRGKSIWLEGEVVRPHLYELKPEEGLAHLLRFCGGLTAHAAADVVHVERILPPAERRPERPDRTYLDIPLDAVTGLPRLPEAALLHDGDVVRVDSISVWLADYVEITGAVKQPGRYEYREGLNVAELLAMAGGVLPDRLAARAIVDRLAPDDTYQALHFHLGDLLNGRAEPLALEPRDVVRVFSRWEVEDHSEVSITGEVRQPGAFMHREGMTLRDLIVQAGGLTESADVLRAEISRLRRDAVLNHDTDPRPERTVDVLTVKLGYGYLDTKDEFLLHPHDQVAIRKLPWWELQRTVEVRGEIFFPGVYSLEGPTQTLSEVIVRAGGLKPSAFAPGARIIRKKDGVGNIALDLEKALAKPGTQHDIVLAAGDKILIPEVANTVRVIGAVGFPTSIVYEKGKSLGYYVDRAGGYAENADKWKARVVYPNGLSRPIRRIWRDPSVMAGSTIFVPVKVPDEGPGKLAAMKEVAAILASVATIWLVIERTR